MVNDHQLNLNSYNASNSYKYTFNTSLMNSGGNGVGVGLLDNPNDVYVLNSTSSEPCDEVIAQLQEQFGDGRNIYVLNSSSHNGSSGQTSTNMLQYVVVDKEVDINSILNDLTIYQTQSTQSVNSPAVILKNTSAKVKQQQQQQQHPVQLTFAGHNNNNNNSNMLNQQSTVEESIQRVHAPPPKRKNVDFKIDSNKRMTYQDAFLRFLAGEKQPTLEINSNEHANKKPKDNIYYNFYLNNQKSGYKSIPASTSTITNDKENCTNTTRREVNVQTTPTTQNPATYEYRTTTYREENPATVRLNLSLNPPQLPQTAIVRTVQSVPQPHVYTNNSTNFTTDVSVKQSARSSIVIAKNPSNVNIPLADHTYKTSSVGADHLVTLTSPPQLPNLTVQPHKQVAHNFEPDLMLRVVGKDDHEETNISIDAINSDIPLLVDRCILNVSKQMNELENTSSSSFLMQKSSSGGDFNNYDLWCVEQFLQKFEPSLMSSSSSSSSSTTSELCNHSVES